MKTSLKNRTEGLSCNTRNGRSGSNTVLTPLKRDFCFTPESRHRSGYAADCDTVICGGGAKPTDLHLASKVVAIDEEIIEWLERREKRKTPPKRGSAAFPVLQWRTCPL